MTPQELVSEVENLFSLPDVALRLNELVSDPDTTNKQIVDVLQLDASLTATVLRLANSAWFGLSSKVDTLSRAITLIGMGALRDLVLAAAFIKRFQGIPGEFVNMKTFWDNSVACGVVSRNLSKRARLATSEQLFLAGLLHKIGRLVFFVARPNAYREVLSQTENDSEASLLAAEKRVFGYTHAQVGGALLKRWQLPALMQNVVANQSNSEQLTDYPRERAILQVASDMAHFLSPDIKLGPGEVLYTPDFPEVVWMDLGLTPADVTEVADISLIQTYELIEIVNPR
ncbi:MAG: HDOD domain-containing protein [Pseudomonadota bacterium]